LYDVLLHVIPFPVLPVLLGLFSFYLLTLLPLNHAKGYALILFTITPLVITTFTTHSPAALFFPLVLSMYFLSRINPYLALLAIPSLVFTDILAGVVVVLAVG